MICENCHRPIKAGAKFCSYCGAPVREAQAPNPPYGQNGGKAYQENPPFGNSTSVSQKQILNPEVTMMLVGMVIMAIILVISIAIIISSNGIKSSSSSKSDTMSSEYSDNSVSNVENDYSEDTDSAYGEYSNDYLNDSSDDYVDDTSNSEDTSEEDENGGPSDIEDSGIHTYELCVEDCTWSEAYQRAIDKGGHLVRINNADEYNAIINQINTEGKQNIKFYIGGKRDDDSSEYRWVYDVNGQSEYGDTVINTDPEYSSFWLEGEPSYTDSYTQDNEDRLMMFYHKNTGNFVFNDSQDDVLSEVSYYAGTMGYIIEYQ